MLCIHMARNPQKGHGQCAAVLAMAAQNAPKIGTANVFCAVEPKAGRHFTLPTPNRSAPEFAQALGRIVDQYPFARTIHLVMDNLNIHCRKDSHRLLR